MHPQARSVLIVHPHIDFLTPALAERFTVYKAWERLPEAARNSTKALVVAGEITLENEFVASFPNVGLIACLTTGYDGIDVHWAKSRGIAVTRAVGANHEDVADHALGVLIALQREILRGDRIVRDGRWDPNRKIVTGSLEGLNVGIVGMGAIGSAVAARCAPFRMSVAWWGPRPKGLTRFRRAESLEALAKESDVLIICSKADQSNRHMISDRVLYALGPNGHLVNVARGSLVDESALIERLKAGKLAGAALDVFGEEPANPDRWRDVPNVILTPHTAGATVNVLPKLVGQLTSNLEAFFRGSLLLSPVGS